MSRCIELAKNGLGTTYPNPLVGSVLVYNNLIIGEGWHYKAGKAHAEVHAITNSKTNTNALKILQTTAITSHQQLLKKATLYVSLEPCSHSGKTPPCADLIITIGIKNVIIGCVDPNPKVAGKGILRLQNAGCKVTQGVLEEQCKALNKRFFTFQNKKRPYVFLKWAQTTDGYIAPITKDKKEPLWISNIYSRQQVHKLRAQEQGIVIGTTTALADNPSLTTRQWAGTSPTRLVIDKNLKIPKIAAIFNDKAPTIVITQVRQETTQNTPIIYEYITFEKNLALQICAIAHKHNLQSIIIEGGAKTLQTFIDENIWDQAIVYTGKMSLENGIKAPIFNTELHTQKSIKDTSLCIYKNTTQ
jgi:diaminohydroxyphosphoribosylaminopyrimidine deaminase/5-amino-6-(5-phosphoribosylamino)uracil reductase